MHRSGPKSVLCSTVNVYAPINSGVLKRAGEREQLIGSAEWVFGARAQQVGSAYVIPIFGAGGWQGRMDRGECLEWRSRAGKFEHDSATGTVAERCETVVGDAGRSQENAEP